MATFFPSSDNQRDASTIHQLRETLPGSYPEGPVLPGNMMMYMNYSSSSGSFSSTLPGNTQQQSSCIAIMPGASDSNPSEQEMLSDLGGSRIAVHDLNEWKDVRTSMLLMHPIGGAASVFQGAQNLQGQGLSLSLGTHVQPGFQMSSFQCQTPDLGYSSFLGTNPSISGEDTGRNAPLGNSDNSPNKQSRNSDYMSTGFPGSNSNPMRTDTSPFGMSTGARVIPNSKYLKAARQLLDEVVNVKKALKEQSSKNRLTKDSKEADGGPKYGASDPPGTGSTPGLPESSCNSPTELSAAEKQDLQNKMTKLLAMLDEVDRRYKQYYHQMQIVVSSFDVIAGSGAAKPYTALALQTISCHFRCLRDAITEQVQVTRQSLGEDDASASNKGTGISRLRYVDQQIRQQRALQQLGMMQQHAWRPQRGLPESSVSILRAWLFEHFLHPYPKDSDKLMLARQTGLTRSQVSNWFINARVRLWKPMVEEMYKEEIGDAEMDANSPSDFTAKATTSDAKASEDRGDDLQHSATSIRGTGQLFESRSDHFADVVEPDIDHTLRNASHAETESEYGSGKARGSQRPAMNGYGVIPDTTLLQPNEGGDRLMAAAAAAYHMSELERFENGKGVSLTLGLQQCEGSSLPMSVETQHSYMTTRGDGIYTAAASSMGSEAAEFDCMESGNRHHRFGSSHLLHDFVA